MSAADLMQKMRDGLEGTTPGQWRSNLEGKIHRLVGDGMWFAKLSWTVISKRNNADAAHIARCSPDNIRALLDTLAAKDTALVEALSELETERHALGHEIRIKSEAIADYRREKAAREAAEAALAEMRAELERVNKLNGVPK